MIAKSHNNYHSHQARSKKKIRRRPRNHGAFSLITIMIRDVTMRGPKIFTMDKMFIVVERIKTPLRSSLLKVKSLDKKEIK